MRRIRTTGTAAVALVAVLASGGCGFLGASRVSDTKPNGFVLRGHVTAPLAAGTAGAPGSACTVTSVAAGTPVTVTDPAGKKIASGALGTGVVAPGTSSGPTCDFPFQIRAVPGGVDRYGISVGGRPPQTFPAKALHQDEAAVITLNG